MTPKEANSITLFWFRRDLRLHDNVGLAEAEKEEAQLLPLFIFDPWILEHLEEKADPRLQFIHQCVLSLDQRLRQEGGGLLSYHQDPAEVFQQLAGEMPIKSVHCNRDHEPYARERDAKVERTLKEKGISFHQHDDQNIFPPERVRKPDGTAYKVFTPYKRKAKERFDPKELEGVASIPDPSLLAPAPSKKPPSLEELGFQPSSVPIPSSEPDEAIIRDYHEKRDLPAEKGTTKLGIHLRFGTLSIRELGRKGQELNTVFLDELIWRDFFQMILHDFPEVVDHAFKAEFDRVEARHDEEAFEAWCEGRTGYPMVDAGMRELKATGYMHNRCRMVTASFLTKHLLIDRRWGEHWFARKLLDYELASNNGNWQWAAGCGCDAAPYFRIFNPQRQLERFDPLLIYVMEWVPEYGTNDYPEPIVEHKYARDRALKTYRSALG